MVVFLSFRSLILNFKDSQEHPSLPEHQAVLFVPNPLEPLADKSDFFFFEKMYLIYLYLKNFVKNEVSLFPAHELCVKVSYNMDSPMNRACCFLLLLH